MASKKLTRIEAATDSPFMAMSKEQLLRHPDKRGAADELYRRAFNHMVKRHQA